VYSSPDTAVIAVNNGAVSLDIDSLLAYQRYCYAVEVNGTLDSSLIGSFSTFPEDTGSFTFAFASCAKTGSDHPVFGTIHALRPLLFFHTGDFHYENISVNDRDVYRQEYEHVLASPGQSRLYRDFPIVYIWDDHDYGPNNSDSTAPGREAARLTYREYVPHYPLAAGDGPEAIYFTFTVGRVKFIVTDCRSARSPAWAPDDPAKTMLGETQKAWFKQELLDAEANYPLVVWLNSLPWIGLTGDDGWHLYSNERREIADFLKDNGIHHLCMLSGDAHMIAIDDGTNSDYATGGGAGFPVMHAASLDQTPSVKGGPYSHGTYPDRGQFGLMTVSDLGDRILVHWRGRNYLDQEVVRYDFMAAAGAISPVICGDANGDGSIGVGDVVHIVDYIFKGGPAPDPLYAADPDGDEAVSVADAVYLIEYIFKGGPDPSCP
jgi:alkaline phosphatase D